MMRYSAKILFGVILFIGTIEENTISAQVFTTGLNATWLRPTFSTFHGQIDEDAYALVTRSQSIDVYGEYRFENGFVMSADLGWQEEGVLVGVQTPFTSGFNGKHFQSYFCGARGGYSYHFAQSRFFAFLNLGLGFGFKNQPNATKEHEVNIIQNWYDPQSGNMVSDTMHFVTIIIDYDQPNVDVQWRASLGAEYRKKHLYARVYMDFRGWFHKIAEMQFVYDRIYNFQEDTHVPPFHQHSTGHIIARAAYSGFGVGLGWYFSKA